VLTVVATIKNFSWFSVLTNLAKAQVLISEVQLAILCTGLCLLQLFTNVTEVRFLRHFSIIDDVNGFSATSYFKALL